MFITAIFFSLFSPAENSIFDNTGITVIDAARLKATAALTAIAISPKSCPASSFIINRFFAA